MKKRIIAAVVATMMVTSLVAGCGDEAVVETSEETTVVETEVVEETEAVVETEEVEETEAVVETTVEETEVEETEVEESEVNPVDHENTIPQAGDTYNGHVVDHTEDQPNCGDSSHGTIFIFYVDSDDIDFVEY